MKESDLKIIAKLRKNARNKVTNIAKDMKIPVTTIYDKIRSQYKKGIYTKHASLIDYSKLGYFANSFLTIKVEKNDREKLKNFLNAHPNINSIYRIDSGHDFMIETVFENVGKQRDFIDETENLFHINEIRPFTILQEIKKEGFLAE